jgi:SAM-dependent methyltransferase
MVMADPPVPAYASGFADRYDDWFAKPAASAVRMLAGLAGAGPVLELGIGTGRVAVPLRERGVAVHGIDCSEQMVASMRRKPGGRDIPVTMGDFADVAVSGEFSVIYLASGTFFELTSQQDQLRCLRNAAGRLRPGGVVVLDAFFPEALCQLAAEGERTVPTSGVDPVRCTRTMDRAAQRYYSRYTVTSVESVTHVEVSFRYAGMGELDLMARLAGLRLRDRWGDWDGGPVQRSSVYHVSCYEIDPAREDG